MSLKAPGPTGNRVMGSLAAFQKDSLGYLSSAAEQHGDFVHMRFAHINTHLINHPDYIDHVLRRNADDFDKDTRSVAKVKSTCGNSLLSANEPAWERQRKLIQPVFLPRYLESAGPVIDETMVEVLDRWQRKAKAHKPIEMVSEMMHLVITISAKILFTSDVNADLIERSLEVILADTWRRMQSPIDLSDVSTVFHRPAFKKALAQINNVVFDIISERRKSGIMHDDVLSRLLVAHEAHLDTSLSDRELRDAAITLLLAGHETTANALSWAFYKVAQYPEQGFESSNLHHVFAETVRLYPSIWIMERRVKQDTQIGPYKVARGTSILMSPYLLHRHTDFWPNPEVFDPRRFEREQAKQRRPSSYLPFGLGRHRCVGHNMATLVATRVMKNVFERFRLTLLPGANDSPDPGITLRHTGKLYMQVRHKGAGI